MLKSKFYIMLILVILNALIIFPSLALDKPQNQTTDIQISYFGTGKVELIENANECMIAITGKDQDNRPLNLAIWLPDSPMGIFIFPWTTDASRAIKILDNFFKIKKPRPILSNSYLFLDHQFTILMTDMTEKNKFQILLASMDENLTELLSNNDHFLVQFYHYYQDQIIKTVRYDLNGINEAINAYNSSCKK